MQNWTATVTVRGKGGSTHNYVCREDAAYAVRSWLGKAYGHPVRRTNPDYEYTLGVLDATIQHGKGDIWVSDPHSEIEAFVTCNTRPLEV